MKIPLQYHSFTSLLHKHVFSHIITAM